MANFGSPIDAFNIGRAGGAAESPAIGLAIRQIVEQGDKMALVQGQSGAQTAGAIATAQFKDTLSRRPEDVLVQRPGGGFDFVEQVPGGKGGILGAAPQTSIPQAVGGQLQQQFQGPTRRFNAQGIQIQDEPTPAPTPAPGGAQRIGATRDPNLELTPEEEALFRLQMGLPPS